MTLVRREIDRLHDTLGRDSAAMLFTAGTLRAVRPEELTDDESQELAVPLKLEERVSGILHRWGIACWSWTSGVCSRSGGSIGKQGVCTQCLKLGC